MLVPLILPLFFLRFILRNLGGDSTFALILITMFFVKLSTNDFSDIEKACHLKRRRPNYNTNYNTDHNSDNNSDSDCDYYNKQDKNCVGLELKVLELKRTRLEDDLYFQRLWTYTMFALFFFICAVCILFAFVYTAREYYQPEQVSQPEHKILGFVVAVAVIAVAAHQV